MEHMCLGAGLSASSSKLDQRRVGPKFLCLPIDPTERHHACEHFSGLAPLDVALYHVEKVCLPRGARVRQVDRYLQAAPVQRQLAPERLVREPVAWQC